MDRNYPGPCSGCLTVCNQLPDTIVVTTSGIEICSGCQIFDGIGLDAKLSTLAGGLNGAFTLTRITGFEWTFSSGNLVSVEEYRTGDGSCGGAIFDTEQFGFVFTVTCAGGKWSFEITVTSGYFFTFNDATGGGVTADLTEPINNVATNCGIVSGRATNGFFGGTATLSF